MRKILVLFLAVLIIGGSCFAQGLPTAQRGFRETFTATGSGTVYSQFGTGNVYHKVVWNGRATVSTCAAKLEKSVDGTTFTDLIDIPDCTTNGASVVALGVANFVRLRQVTLTGAGATIDIVYNGWPIDPTERLITTADKITALPMGGTLVSGLTAAMTSTTTTQVVAAVASNYLYITSCNFSNDHASVKTHMRLQDGSGGTAIFDIYVSIGVNTTVIFPTPLKVPTLGNALFVVNVTTGSSTWAACSGWASTVSY